MGMRNTLDLKGGGAPPIDKMLGTAYETVSSLVQKLPVIEYLEKNIDGFVSDIHNALDASLQSEQTAIAKAAEALASQLASAASEAAAHASELAAAQSAADLAAAVVAADASATAAHASELAAAGSEAGVAANAAAADVSRIAAQLSETNAGTSEANALAKAAAALASQVASALSETNAAASETASALSATASQTAQAASEAARDASAASANDALTSENHAHASELASAASATAAADSAAVATAQASLSTDNANSAATSAVQLAAALATFNAQWLGPHASDPTLDNNGHALQVGAEYLNTTLVPPQIRVYTASGWQDQDLSAENASTNANLAATNASASAAAASASQTASAASAAAAAQSAADANSLVNSELVLNVAAADVTLTAPQAANGIYKFTGQLTGNRIVTVPATPHPFVVYNNTTSPGGQSYTLTIVALGQAPSVQVLRGKANSLFSDATGVYATSAAAGVSYSGVYPLVDNATLDVTHIGALVVQTVAAKTTTLAKASTYPVGGGVTVKSLVASSLALQAGDTCDDLVAPYAMLAEDTVYLVSDGVSKWTVGWFTNKKTPVFDGMITSKSGGVTFPDGSVQTTAQGLTQATSVVYTKGATDTVGSFAAGDTRLRTAGFVAPFVSVWRVSGRAYPGVHYNLDADGIHINWLDGAFLDTDDFLVEIRFPYNPSTVYVPGMQGFTTTPGQTFIPFAHTAGCAYLLNIGAFMRPGLDYTDDNTGFYLQGWSCDANTELSVFNLNPITIAQVLSNLNPVIAQGVLQFADGTQQNSAALPVGQCYLSPSGSTLVLMPKDGNKLNIAGKLYVIPAAGVTLAAAGAVANTTYYIYAYMAGSVMTLEYSTTGHSQDANTGVEIKTGDSSRTLVGMGRATATGSFAANSSQITCISWFNRRRRVASNSTNGLSLGAGPAGVFAGVSILTWVDDPGIQLHGWSNSQSSAVSTTTAYVARDTVAATLQSGTSYFQANAPAMVDARGPIAGNEAFSVYSLYMSINAGTLTATWAACEVAFMG
ncbi:hypothetical protein SB861_37820 [Paraburkholderia sp. SIMBA_049]